MGIASAKEAVHKRTETNQRRGERAANARTLMTVFRLPDKTPYHEVLRCTAQAAALRHRDTAQA